MYNKWPINNKGQSPNIRLGCLTLHWKRGLPTSWTVRLDGVSAAVYMETEANFEQTFLFRLMRP